jgi:hypothetical protein
MRARCFHRSGSNRFVGDGGARGRTPHLRSTTITLRSNSALVRMSSMSRSNLRAVSNRTGAANASEEALSRLREIMGKLKLTVNEDKTRICKVPEGEFDFLGYSFGRMYSLTSSTIRPLTSMSGGMRSYGGRAHYNS